MTKKYLYYFLYPIVLFLLQTAALKVFPESAHLVPQLLLLFVVIFALSESLTQVVWMSFAVGFSQELFSGLFFGSFIAASVITGAMIYFITRNLTAQEVPPTSAGFLIALGSVVFPGLVFLFNYLGVTLNLARVFAFTDFYSARIFWTILLNIGFFFPLNFIFKFLNRAS